MLAPPCWALVEVGIIALHQILAHEAALSVYHDAIRPFLGFPAMRFLQGRAAIISLLGYCKCRYNQGGHIAHGARNAPLAEGKAKMANGNEKIEGAQIEGEGAQLNEGAPMIEAPAPEAPKAAKKAKAAPKAKPAAKAAPKAKKGLAARNDRFAAEKAKAEAAKAARPLSAGSDIGRDAEMHFSGLAHNMPSASDIEKAEGLCKRMIGRDLARYKAALSGQLPIGEFEGAPIDLKLQTHSGYKGKWKALKALIDAGDLAALEGWNNGLGIRQNSSSSKPLGRFHQCAILALRAKAAAKAKRQAGKAAKAAPEAGEGEGAQA